jgi:hypothetical protein
VTARFLPERERADAWGQPILRAQRRPGQIEGAARIAEAGCLVALAHQHVGDPQGIVGRPHPA